MKIRILILSIIFAYSCADSKETLVSWQEYPQLPPAHGATSQYGLASPFAGISNGSVIVAGGSNFPDRPLAEGGAKCFHDDIFVLTEKNGAPEWLSGFRLDKPVAGGASVSLRDGLLCIGGSGYDGIYRDVFLLTWNEESLKVEKQVFPPLPFPMVNMGAALLENVVYVAGGSTDDGASNKFLKLDLTKQQTPEFRWEILPDFPGYGRQLPVMVAQYAAGEPSVFLFSGLVFPETSDDPVIHTNGLKYNPKEKTWQTLSDIQTEPAGKTHVLYAGSGVKFGKNSIVCMGGANYDILLDALKRERVAQIANQSGNTDAYRKHLEWKQFYLTQPLEWYRLNTDILTYHTQTGQWKEIGELPFPAVVCAAAVEWKNGWLLISGEVKPGVRTPKVYYGELRIEN